MKLDELVSEERQDAMLDAYPIEWPMAVGAVKEIIRTAVREGAVAALERACKAQCLICGEGHQATYLQHHAMWWHLDYMDGDTTCDAAAIRSLTIED